MAIISAGTKPTKKIKAVRGDSFLSIAKKNGTDPAELINLNRKLGIDRPVPGSPVVVPARPPRQEKPLVSLTGAPNVTREAFAGMSAPAFGDVLFGTPDFNAQVAGERFGYIREQRKIDLHEYPDTPGGRERARREELAFARRERELSGTQGGRGSVVPFGADEFDPSLKPERPEFAPLLPRIQQEMGRQGFVAPAYATNLAGDRFDDDLDVGVRRQGVINTVSNIQASKYPQRISGLVVDGVLNEMIAGRNPEDVYELMGAIYDVDFTTGDLYLKSGVNFPKPPSVGGGGGGGGRRGGGGSTGRTIRSSGFNNNMLSWRVATG
jgi:LysM repeat protein